MTRWRPLECCAFDSIQSNQQLVRENQSNHRSSVITHLDHGSTVRYHLRLQLVQEFGLHSGQNSNECRWWVGPIDCASQRDANKRETLDWRDGWWIAHVGDRIVGSMVNQELDALIIALERCQVERCVVAGIDSIDVGMSTKKELDALMMVIQSCLMEWCAAFAHMSIDVGVSIKKELDALMVAIRRCQVEWCRVVVINRIDVGTSIKQELGALIMATTRYPME